VRHSFFQPKHRRPVPNQQQYERKHITLNRRKSPSQAPNLRCRMRCHSSHLHITDEYCSNCTKTYSSIIEPGSIASLDRKCPFGLPIPSMCGAGLNCISMRRGIHCQHCCPVRWTRQAGRLGTPKCILLYSAVYCKSRDKDMT
jgi:hypothetical protein